MLCDSDTEVLFVTGVQCVAFHDVYPQAPIHFIVIPKQLIGQISNCSDAEKQVIGQAYCSCDGT